MIVLDYLGTGAAVGEDDTIFPDELAGGWSWLWETFDEIVHLDDEAGEDASGHEFIFVAEN